MKGPALPIINISGLQMKDKISLSHGNGGLYSRELLEEVIFPVFHTSGNSSFTDSALLELPSNQIAYTTDSYVIRPIFFRGGNIGKLAVCGTLNDLAVCGAKPLVLSCGLILEEGLAVDDLRKVLLSMQETASSAGVKIVTGDTKVVEKGQADKIYINTSGIGIRFRNSPLGIDSVEEGDEVIVSGTVGDHGASVFLSRNEIQFDADIQSDCGNIFPMAEAVLNSGAKCKIMRDPTRGGIATTLNEFVYKKNFSIEVEEENVPVLASVQAVCEILGMDPYYMANEGKFLTIVSKEDSESVLKILQSFEKGKSAKVIGRVTGKYKGLVYLKTLSGGERILDLLVKDMLPRIC